MEAAALVHVHPGENPVHFGPVHAMLAEHLDGERKGEEGRREKRSGEGW